MAEYFLAILTVQSPVRHSVILRRGAGLAVSNVAKTQHVGNVPYRTLGTVYENGLNSVIDRGEYVAKNVPKIPSDVDCSMKLLFYPADSFRRPPTLSANVQAKFSGGVGFC